MAKKTVYIVSDNPIQILEGKKYVTLDQERALSAQNTLPQEDGAKETTEVHTSLKNVKAAAQELADKKKGLHYIVFKATCNSKLVKDKETGKLTVNYSDLTIIGATLEHTNLKRYKGMIEIDESLAYEEEVEEKVEEKVEENAKEEEVKAQKESVSKAVRLLNNLSNLSKAVSSKSVSFAKEVGSTSVNVGKVALPLALKTAPGFAFAWYFGGQAVETFAGIFPNAGNVTATFLTKIVNPMVLTPALTPIGQKVLGYTASGLTSWGLMTAGPKLLAACKDKFKRKVEVVAEQDNPFEEESNSAQEALARLLEDKNVDQDVDQDLDDSPALTITKQLESRIAANKAAANDEKAEVVSIEEARDKAKLSPN